MKITRLLFWTGLALMLVVGVMAISQSHAAQKTVSAVGVPANLGAYRVAVNAELSDVQDNFTELYTLKADKSCFATESAFNACFDLTWNTGGTTYTAGTGITITDGVITSTVTDTDTFASWDKDYNDLINAPTGGSMTWPSSAGIAVYGGSETWGTSIAASSLLVGDATAGPFFDGTIDGGTTLKFYGPNGYWQALQAGASTANRSWRLMIGAPPAAGTTTLLNVDEYGQMGQVATSTYLTPSGVGGALTFTASGFNGNLLTTDNTLQELADAVDNLDLSSAFDPASPGAIGGTTPAAGTFTTLGAGSSGFAVDADGDTTAKSFAATRTTSPQALELYEGTGGGSNKVTIAPSAALGADKSIVAENILQTTDASANGLSLIGAANYAAMRTLLDLEAGTDFNAYDADLTTWAGVTPGTGVGTMLAIAPGSAGGPTTTIASGTSALGTGAISSGACASVVTTTATNTATTDVINWGFNGSPAAVTGYVASANGMLTIIAYPSSGNVNFLVCNNTAASITPGAVTLNWRVQR